MIIFLIFNIPNILIFSYSKDITSFLLSLFFSLTFFLYKNFYIKIFITIGFILYPFYIFYTYQFKKFPDENILMVLLESNFQEIYSYMGDYAILVIIGYIFYLFFILYLISTYEDIKVSKPIKLIIIFIFLSLLILLNYLNKDFSDISYEDDFDIYKTNIIFKLLKNTFPLNFYISVNDLIMQENIIKNKVNKDFNFNVTNTKKSNNTNIILVIGESSRRSNWSLNNYIKKTNPLLIKQKNIINFSNMVSISNITRSSIPIIITRKNSNDADIFYFKEPSIITLFNQAGYETFWLSMQQQYGFFDNTTSIYSKEAKNINFLNNADYSTKGKFDSTIIEKLNYIMSKKKSKKLIIIHTLGSHQKYSDRYPENYDYFKPSLNELNIYDPRNPKYKTQSINSYDNSILYTDYVLNQIIEVFKKNKDEESFLLYSSDHGEDLFDNTCNKSGHGNATIYNYEIASFTWYSDLYQKNNPEKIIWLEKNKNRKINQTSIFPTLVDAASLNILNDPLNRSLLKNFKNYPRLVNGGLNFDEVPPQGICKEIQ